MFKMSVSAMSTDNRISVSNLRSKRRAIGNGSMPPLYSNPLIFSSHITDLSLVEEKKYISLLVVDVLLFALEG